MLAPATSSPRIAQARGAHLDESLVISLPAVGGQRTGADACDAEPCCDNALSAIQRSAPAHPALAHRALVIEPLTPRRTRREHPQALVLQLMPGAA